MAPTLPLSILDLVPLADGESSADALAHSLDVARLADRLGFTRLWYAEHHSMPAIASTTPEIMIARAAMVTERLRVGAGGVMLPNHSPLKVAESYRLLEALAPGRVDLGLGRAPGTDQTTALALRRSREAMFADDFTDQLAELLAFGNELPREGPFRAVTAQPEDAPLPPVWLLGSSDYSALLAARIGRPFAFAAHFSPTAPEGPMLAYRERFKPGAIEAPLSMLAVSVFCAESREVAERLARPALVSFAKLRTGRPTRLMSTEAALAYTLSPVEESAVAAIRALQIVGTPDEVHAKVTALAERNRADEVMLATFSSDHEGRMRSYELVARAFGLC